ncbi:Alanine aminotransferase 1 [Strongyloides ratti]|uniref:alanine transaminase n=1 Tax=Strongyloides ratti TaxID=34506 RepID=A0A090MZ83_STRRB|nr:Alanine aminotransferase 1 [Strongyloides ratti]CEF68484.1 Alanine aminotransferase 1 [Strongyloides ratti]
MSSQKVLNLDNLNPNVKTMQYAVRGPLPIRAVQIEKELASGVVKPFKNVIKANIGDAHAMGQKPITFIRQVIACICMPQLMENKDMPKDVIEHASAILNGCGGKSAGSYSLSNGIEIIRKNVAKYIEKRDGYKSDPELICLSGGASESIRNVLKLFINKSGGKKVGIMIPIPQYPLYSATIEEFNLGQVGYYLNESNNWSLDVSELEKAYEKSKSQFDTRVICIINPGNPTGQVLVKENIEAILKFAFEKKLFVLADEVYQDNVYSEGSKFHSFKSVLMGLGEPYSSSIELASFHSVSKGYMGECGLRGGYVEFANIDGDVFAEFKKMTSAKLCSTVVGQAVIDTVVNPPKPGEESYEQWNSEKNAVLASLKERATLVKEAYEKLEGITCNPVQGAMYAFPRVHLPTKAIEKAKSLGQEPDFFYAMSLLEETGICVVPGSGFGQREGTYHFRTTILPQPELMKEMMERFTKFHNEFMKKYE